MMEYKIGERYEIAEVLDTRGNGTIGTILTVDRKDSWSNILLGVKKNNVYGYVLDWYKLKKLEEPMFKVGDIVVNTDGDESKVLAVIENCFLKSLLEDFDIMDRWYTFEEVKRYGWKLKPTTTKLSMDQIADKFGINVDNLEIMKEE